MKISRQLRVVSYSVLLLVCLHATSGCESTATRPASVTSPNEGGPATELQTPGQRASSQDSPTDGAAATASPQTYQADRVALERREREEVERERQRQKLKTISGGAVAIGVLGTAIGALVPDGGRIKSAAIGAATGAASGSVAGNYVANKQQAIGRELDVLDAMISDVRAAQTRLEGDIRLVDRIIADQRSQLRQLNADLASKRIKRQQYQNRVAQLQRDRTKAQAIASSSRMELEKFRGASKYVREGGPEARNQPRDGQAQSSSGRVGTSDKKTAQGSKLRLYDKEVRSMSGLVDQLDNKVAQWGKLDLDNLQRGS